MLALLLPDPCDPLCPQDFKCRAWSLLQGIVGRAGGDDLALRHAILDFIALFSRSKSGTNDLFIKTSRQLVNSAYGDPPLVVDSFAGGGSIPLEALRVGCDVFASDSNPIAALLLRVILTDAPRSAPTIASKLRSEAENIQSDVDSVLREYYWRASVDSEPIAYLWSRTVKCETPNCGAEVPIYGTPWLSKRGASKAKYFKESSDGGCVALVVDSAPRGGPIQLRIARGMGSEDELPDYVLMTATKVKGNSGGVICPCCNTTLPGSRTNPRVQTQLTAQKGGADVVFAHDGRRVGGARLLAVVERVSGQARVRYRQPCDADYDCIYRATLALKDLENSNDDPNLPSLVPNEAISLDEIRRISVPLYGVRTWGDLFTVRQKLALALYARAIRAIKDGQVARCAALALDRVVMLSSAHCRWKASGESLIDMFGRHAMGMEWNFAEAAVVTNTNGIFARFMSSIADAMLELGNLGGSPGQVELLDACATNLPSEAAEVWFVDPPYYDSIPYAHLADVFYVWLRRALGDREKQLFSGSLSDKTSECVVDRPHRLSQSLKTPAYFEAKIAEACAEGRRITSEAGVGCIVFAHKTTEGWEALLKGVLDGGWCITASWPIATELPSRLHARETASLATSVHLICRPRTGDEVGEWSLVARELPRRVAEWMSRLQAEGIRGADLVFACIGPALELYSRYARVVDAEDRVVPLGGDPEATEPHKRGYLAYVWEVVGKTALEQVLGAAETRAREGAAGALEEDARLTALFLWTLQTTSAEDHGEESVADVEADTVDDEDEQEGTSGRRKPGFTLIYDVARRFAQPLGIHMDAWEGRIIETKKGVVRLLPIRERARILFGEAGADIAADRIERAPAGAVQLDLFAGIEPEAAAPPAIRGRGRGRRRQAAPDESLETRQEATTLDRVHAAMLLQASGRSNALRALLAAEMSRSPDFLRLANALAALYPKGSEEKRLVEAMLLAAPK
jgi:adenine-specific DNA methylase